MAKRRRYGNRGNGAARRDFGASKSGGAAVQAPVKKEPAYSEAAQALIAEAERREQERAQQPQKEQFVPKPKAIRRYERYSNMG